MLPGDQEALINQSVRIDRLLKRVERLETLEFGTVAFPSGGADMICFEHKRLSGISDSVTFAAIPATHRHILILHQVSVFLVTGGFRFQEMNFNGDFGLKYDYFWRQQSLLANVNHDAAAAGLMQVGSIPAKDFAFVGPNRYFTAGHIWIPNYSISLGSVFQSVVWDNFSYDASDSGGEGTGRRMREEGGGHFRDTGAISSITFTCSGPQVFQTNSRWTLLLVCEIPTGPPPPPE